MIKSLIVLSLIFPTICLASGADLIKTWRNKQEAYFKGEALVQSNSEIAAEKIENLLKDYKWEKEKKLRLMHQLAELYLSVGRVNENNQNKKIDRKTQRALDLYAEIVDKHSDYKRLEDVLFSYGFELFIKDDYKKSGQVLKTLNKKYPQSDYKYDALLIRADAKYELKNFNEASHLYEQVFSSNNKDLVVYSLYKNSWSTFNSQKHNKAYQKLVSFIKSDFSRGTTVRDNAILDLPLFYSKQSQKFSPYRDISAFLERDKVEEALSQTSEIFFEEGEWKKSIKVYDDLTTHFPSSQDKAYYLLKKGVALSTKKDISRSGKSIAQGLKECKNQKCQDYANSNIFKLVNGWEKYWRKKKSEEKNYLTALKAVYPNLAQVAEKEEEKSKIYLLLAELEIYSESYLKASYAFEKAYLHNKKADYAEKAFWQSILALEKLPRSHKWSESDLKRLERLVAQKIENSPSDPKSVEAQKFLAEIYIQNHKRNKALLLYAHLSHKYMYSETGTYAYNQFLKAQSEAKKHKSILTYLLDYRKKDTQGSHLSRVNKDLDLTYEDWSQENIKNKNEVLNIKLYRHALENRANSKLAKDWQWNLAFSLYEKKSYKKAAQEFLKYEKIYKNKDQKQILALENAFEAFTKIKKRADMLHVANRLEKTDRKNREDWILTQAQILIESHKPYQAYQKLRGIKLKHQEKNDLFPVLVSGLDKKDLRSIIKKGFHFSLESKALARKTLIKKINHYESKEVRDLAYMLSKMKIENTNLKAFGFYSLAMHKTILFSEGKHKVSKNLDRSLDKLLKTVLEIDADYRKAIELSTDLTVAKAFSGLGGLFCLVPKHFYSYAKKNTKDLELISSMSQVLAPFFKESLSFLAEAERELSRSQKDSVEHGRTEKNIRSNQKYVVKLKKWFEKRAVKHHLLSKNERGVK